LEKEGAGSGKKDRWPRAAEIDASGEFPWDIVKVFAQEGFLSLLIPKEYGGGEADVTSFCLVAEEIAKYCASSALLVIVQAVGPCHRPRGTEELKRHYLTRIAKEGKLVCFCLTEPETGSDAASIRTKAIRKDGYYLLNGRRSLSRTAELRTSTRCSPPPIRGRRWKESPVCCGERSPRPFRRKD